YSIAANIPDHVAVPAEIRRLISAVKNAYDNSIEKEKNAIFADSLANLYRAANQFDSAGWYAEVASEYYNTPEHWTKAADDYYQAFTLALTQESQRAMAAKAQEYYGKVLAREPDNLNV